MMDLHSSILKYLIVYINGMKEMLKEYHLC